MAPRETREGLDRIWTVPNALTVSRLVFLVGFLLLLFNVHNRVSACFVLAIAGITDFLDGYVARRFNQVTTIGKMLDPTVDRMVLVTSIISMVVYGAVPIWLLAIVLGREVLVSVTVLILAALGAKRIDVLWIGKAGTFGLMVCFPLLLIGHGPGDFAHALVIIARVLVVPALICSWASAAAYVPVARQALASRRLASVGSDS